MARARLASTCNFAACNRLPPFTENLYALLILGRPSVRAENGESAGLVIVNVEAQAEGVPVYQEFL